MTAIAEFVEQSRPLDDFKGMVFCAYCRQPCERVTQRDGDEREDWWTQVSGPPCNHGEDLVDWRGEPVPLEFWESNL